jgi:phosphoenolpyruvate synthase/pyruvate phosphate dikinase
VNKKVVLRGISIMVGVVKGMVAVCEGDESNLPNGKVLVSGKLSPQFAILAKTKEASAIIVDGGSLVCHGSLIVREFGIPCVVQAKTPDGKKCATKTLKNGQEVLVDADRGIIYYVKNTEGARCPKENHSSR